MSKIDDNLKKNITILTEENIFQEYFKPMIESVLMNYLESTANYQIIDQIKENCNKSDKQKINRIYNSLTLLVTDYGIKNLSMIEISSNLKELNFNEGQIKLFTKLYNKFKKQSQLLQVSSQDSIHMNQLCDVDISASIQIADDDEQQKDQYFINLSVYDENAQIIPIKFKCSYEQLQDLAYNVQVAYNSVLTVGKDLLLVKNK